MFFSIGCAYSDSKISMKMVFIFHLLSWKMMIARVSKPPRIRSLYRFYSDSRHVSNESFKVAIVGSGPAGFYTAHHLLQKTKDALKIDFFERLPTPFGLSRYGVAPDHPEVKNCEEYLENIMRDYRSSQHRVRFFGNVNVGKDISLRDLETNYNAIVLSYGCTNNDNQLKVAGSDLPGVIPARKLVHWYNGHPDFYEENDKFVPPPLDKVEDVTIIGNGNVALDVARCLLASPDTHWNKTDMSSEAIDMLKSSKVKNVNIVARRGVSESAFSNKEIRELFELSKSHKVKFIPVKQELLDEQKLKNPGRVEKRRLALIEKYSKEDPIMNDDTKTWSLQYLMSPIEFVQNEKSPELLSETKFTINELTIDKLTNTTKVKGTAQVVSLKNELVILSIGYKGLPLPDLEANNILFENNRIINHDGRVLSSETRKSESDSAIFKKGFYTSGWIKNGPKGVIATTMMDSFATADNILEDFVNGQFIDVDPDADLISRIEGKAVIWDNWLTLDNHEKKKGMLRGKPREKVCNAEDMLNISKSQSIE